MKPSCDKRNKRRWYKSRVTSEIKDSGIFEICKYERLYLYLSAMDGSDLITMKNVASCEMQCDMQTSVNH